MDLSTDTIQSFSHKTPSLIRRFFSGTFLSRLSGLARDLVMAISFGDHPSVAAFMVAFRLSNLLRRLFGEGPFQSAFIPYFEDLRSKNHQQALLFFRQLMILMIGLLLALVITSEIGLAILKSIFFFSSDNQEILDLSQWLLPGVIFICLYGLNLSFLHCHDSFFIPSFAPFICNLIWIFAALYTKNWAPLLAMRWIAKSVVLGYFLQWCFTLPFVFKYLIGDWRRWIVFKIPKEVKGLARFFSLGAVGVGAVQINAFFDAIFARAADLRGPTYLWYSIRIEQLVLALIGMACITPMIPRLSQAIKTGQTMLAQNLFQQSYSRLIALLTPSTFGLIILGEPLITFLYGKGNFSFLAIQKTTFCLWAYSLGLIPTVMIMLFSAVFYAQGLFQIPLRVSFLSLGTHLFLNTLFVFIFDLGAISTALSTSFSAIINAVVLGYMLKQQRWKMTFSWRQMGMVCGSSLLASLGTLGVFYGISSSFSLPFFHHSLFKFLIPYLTFLGVLAILALLSRDPDLLEPFYVFLGERFFKKRGSEVPSETSTE